MAAEVLDGAIAQDSTRFDAIDATRGIAISLVVVGHTLRGLVSARILDGHGPVELVDQWIYAFHMPLFFVLSGVFMPRAAERGLATYGYDRLSRLGYPYLVWAVSQEGIRILLSRYTNHPTKALELWKILYVPPMQFWFLYALLIISLFSAAMWKLLPAPIGLLVLAFLLFASEGRVSLGPWGVLYQARHNFIYFVVGVVSSRFLLLRLPALPRMAIGSGALFGFVILTSLVLAHLTDQRHPGYSLLAALAGSLATLTVVLLPLVKRLWPALRVLGISSLAIYVAHTIASAGVRIALQKLLHIHYVSVHVVMGIAAGLLLPLYLHRLCARLDFPYLFEWPSTPKARRVREDVAR